MGKQPSEKPLQVFSFSADAFDRIMSKKKQQVHEALKDGFADATDTGIPALRDALNAITWDNRIQNARSFLDEVKVFLETLKKWSAGASSEHKMEAEERALLDSRLQTEIRKLQEVFLVAIFKYYISTLN